jgi:ribose-phosphate pyrophosphokinase
MTQTLNAQEVRFFSGRSNVPLAEKIAHHVGVPLEPTHFSRFSNDNLFVQLGASVRGRIVYIVQSLTPPVSDHLMGLLMMLDIAKGAAAKEIHAVIPYFSYARSDKKDKPRISITARLVADLLQTAGAKHVMTMTLHSPQVHGFFGVPADPLTARWLLADHFRNRGYTAEDTVIVAPDVGSAKAGERFGDMLGLPVAAASKTRISDTKVEIGGMVGRQVRGFKRAIIHDDEIATGGSVVELSQHLLQFGVQEIILACTHGLFLGKAIERIQSIPEIVEVVTTDTVLRPPEREMPNLVSLSVAPVFGNAILKNYYRQSIGDLFTYWDDQE